MNLVFGGGFLGKRIGRELGYRVIEHKDLDLLDIFALRRFLDENKPEVVINCVGKTGRPNIDECENKKEETVQLNINAAVNLATECAKREIYFVHLGSGCVYYGNKNGEGYSEEDEPNFYGPQFYAKTKILAEKILKEFPGLIVRLRMPIDDRPNERNLIDKMKKYSKVIDIKNSKTTVPHMIKALKVLIEKRKNGIYNFTNPGAITGAEIMRMYKEVVNPNHNFEIMSEDELDSVTLGKRSNCILDTRKLEKELKGTGAEMPEIHEAVKECLIKYKESLKSD